MNIKIELTEKEIKEVKKNAKRDYGCIDKYTLQDAIEEYIYDKEHEAIEKIIEKILE